MIHDGCVSPSSDPTSTCVDNPSPREKTGTHTTVAKRESMRAWRLTMGSMALGYDSQGVASADQHIRRFVREGVENRDIAEGLAVLEVLGEEVGALPRLSGGDDEGIPPG